MCILILLNILLLQHLVIKFVIGLRQVGDFLQVLLFPPRPIKTDRLDITIHHSSSHSPIRCGSRHLPKGGGAFFFRKTKSDFKTICFKINQKIPRRNSKLKLQNMVKREITRTSLKIFWFLFVCLFVCLFFLFLRVYILAQKGDSGPGPPLNPPIFANSVYHNVLYIYYWYLQYSRNAMCVLN